MSNFATFREQEKEWFEKNCTLIDVETDWWVFKDNAPDRGFPKVYKSRCPECDHPMGLYQAKPPDPNIDYVCEICAQNTYKPFALRCAPKPTETIDTVLSDYFEREIPFPADLLSPEVLEMGWKRIKGYL